MKNSYLTLLFLTVMCASCKAQQSRYAASALKAAYRNYFSVGVTQLV